jgi:hypothetical protein
VVEGDVLDGAKLNDAMAGQNVVYANLAGDLERMAKSVVEAMRETGVGPAALDQLNGYLRRGAG